MIVLLNDPLNVLSVEKSFMSMSVTMEMKNCCGLAEVQLIFN